MNKIKSLQRQVEILDLDKQHLQEELELNKQLLLELGNFISFLFSN